MALSQAEKDELELLELEEQEHQFQLSKRKSSEGFSPQAALEGFGQSGTLGYLSNIQAATEPASAAIYNLLTGSDVEADPYVKARDYYSKRGEQLKAESPKSYYGGMAAGALGTAPVMPGFSAAKGAGALARAGAAAGTGAAYGALVNPGDVEGEISPIQPVERLKGAAVGAAMGAGLQAGAEGLGAAKQYIGEKSKDLAEKLSARALGAERGTIKKLGQEKVQEIGRYGLENKIVTPFASTEDLIARNEAAKKLGGEKMGQVYSAIDEAGASTFNPLESAAQVEKEIGGFYRSPINRGEERQLENTLESILMRGDKNIPISEAQLLKQELGKVANWKNNLNITDKERMARQAYGVVSGNIDAAVEAGANQIGTEGLLNTLREGKKLYGLGSGAETLLENKQAREQGNKLIGLTDWGVLGAGGAGAAVTGGASIPATLAIYGAKKVGEKYGPQIGATGLDVFSKYLMKSPGFEQANPAAIQTLASKLMQRSGDQGQKNFNESSSKESVLQKVNGTKYQQVLQNAAQSGDDSFRAAYYILNQRDEGFRKLLQGDKDAGR